MDKPITLTVTSAQTRAEIRDTITAGDSDAYPLSITFSDLTAITGTVRFRFVRGDDYWDRDATVAGNVASLMLEPAFYAATGTELWVSFEDSNLYTPLHVYFRDIRVPSGNVEASTSQTYPEWAAEMRELDVSIGTVTTLAEGADATASITGTIPDKVLNLGIPVGATGDKGDAATVAVGTVTTLDAGESATVANSGTSAAAVLDFGLPQGAKGDKGDPGLNGSAVPIDDASTAADRVLSASYIKGQLSAIDAQLAQSAERVDDLYNADVIVPGKNLYDKDAITINSTISPTTGVVTYSATYNLSDYIACKPSTTYIPRSSNYTTVVYYNAAKEFISGIYTDANRYFTTPSTAYFFRMQVHNNNKDIEQIELGTVVTTFEAFGLTIKEKLRYDAYPFQPMATLGNDTQALELKKAIKKIELYNPDPTKKYCMGFIMRNATSYNTRIYIYECQTSGAIGTLVCLTAVAAYAEPTGVDEFFVAENDGSNITAKVWLDWSLITNGANYDLTSYAKSGLDFRTYVDTNTDGLGLSLPPTIPAIVGKEINIYFDNIVSCGKVDNYDFDVTCTIGSQQNERWTCIPAAAGTFAMSIDVYKDFQLVATATTSVVVKADTTGNGVTKTCLFIGDSTTQAGTYTGELLTLFGSDVMNIALLGTRGTSPNLHEGYGGWSAKIFTDEASYSDGSSVVTNPFYNSGFDFSYYMTNQSYAGVDVVGIHLGINDIFGITDDALLAQYIATSLASLDEIEASIHAYDADIKVAFLITIPPSATQDAFGKNYASVQTRRRYRINNFAIADAITEHYANRELENIYLIPINVNLDTVHNMSTETVAVNSRNSTTVVRQDNAAHPAASGYYQIADVIYYWLKCQET